MHRLLATFFPIIVISCIVVSAILAVVSFQMSTKWQRSSWAREMKEYDEQRAQMDRVRMSWREEYIAHSNDSMRMGLDRARWDYERDLWRIETERYAEEQRRRNTYEPFWGAPRRVSDRCLTYGTREYTAKLYNILTTENWAEKCQNTAVKIKGRTLAKPMRCEDHVRLALVVLLCSVLRLSNCRVWMKVYTGSGTSTTTSSNASRPGRSSGEVTATISQAIG